jgi:hypothetical protein
VYYEWRLYAPADVTFSAQMIGGSPYDITVRPCNFGSNGTNGEWPISTVSQSIDYFSLRDNASGPYGRYSGRLVSATSGLSAMTASVPFSAVNKASETPNPPSYTAGQHYVDVAHTWGAGSALTFGQVSIMQTVGSPNLAPYFQAQISPALVKGAAQVLILNWRLSVARV